MFLVIEGVDGTGKSTQVGRVANGLRERGREVVETFEPGATAAGAAMRDVLLDASIDLTPLAEALLLAADRAHHLSVVVRPALERGADVVTDRYVPSSLAYQGIARELGVPTVEELNRIATGGLAADLVVVLDVPPDVATTRRGGSDRLEALDDGFHDKVRRAYLDLAAENGWAVLDGSAPPDDVTKRILAEVDAMLEGEQERSR